MTYATSRLHTTDRSSGLNTLKTRFRFVDSQFVLSSVEMGLVTVQEIRDFILIVRISNSKVGFRAYISYFARRRLSRFHTVVYLIGFNWTLNACFIDYSDWIIIYEHFACWIFPKYDLAPDTIVYPFRCRGTLQWSVFSTPNRNGSCKYFFLSIYLCVYPCRRAFLNLLSLPLITAQQISLPGKVVSQSMNEKRSFRVTFRLVRILFRLIHISILPKLNQVEIIRKQ